MDRTSRIDIHGKPHPGRPVRSARGRSLMDIATSIVVLCVLIVALLLGWNLIFASVDAPRTSLERDIMDYTARLQLDPRDAVAHAGLGAAYMKMGRLKEALVEFKSAVRLKPKSAQYHYNLGVAYRDSGRSSEALKALREAKGLARNWDAPFFTSGLIYSEQKKFDKAIREFKVCLDMNPQNADAHFSLAKALSGAGQNEDAAAHFRETLKFVPDYQGVEAALKSLENK